MTIPYILDVIMSCKMHILFKDNKVIWLDLNSHLTVLSMALYHVPEVQYEINYI